MTATTLLELEGIGVPPYSARGLTQTLSPIDAAGNLRRNINGDLRDLSDTQFRKLKSTITGNDMEPPACDDVWPGHIVDVSCIIPLTYETSTGAPRYAVVPGSSKVSGDFTIYRPKIRMMVVNFNLTFDEYGAQYGWTMDLEEV